MKHKTFTKEKPNLDRKWHWNNDEDDFTYQIRPLEEGVLIIQFDRKEEKAILGLFYSKDQDNTELDKEYVLSHLVKNTFNFKWGFDIKQINIQHLYEKVINNSKVSLEIYIGDYHSFLDCKVNGFSARYEIENKEFRNIDTFKAHLSEIKPSLELVGNSGEYIANTFNQIQTLIPCQFSILNYYSLKNSITFCKTYDHDRVSQLCKELIENPNDLNRYINLCDKISTNDKKQKFNITVRGIKFTYNSNIKYIVADIPFTNLLAQNKPEHSVFIVAYLKSIGAFQDLTYRFENIMFNAL